MLRDSTLFPAKEVKNKNSIANGSPGAYSVPGIIKRVSEFQGLYLLLINGADIWTFARYIRAKFTASHRNYLVSV